MDTDNESIFGILIFLIGLLLVILWVTGYAGDLEQVLTGSTNQNPPSSLLQGMQNDNGVAGPSSGGSFGSFSGTTPNASFNSITVPPLTVPPLSIPNLSLPPISSSSIPSQTNNNGAVIAGQGLGSLFDSLFSQPVVPSSTAPSYTSYSGALTFV